MSEFIQLQVTFPSAERAMELGELLVEQHLAACAQIMGPLTSIYHWKEQLEREKETLLLAKTKAEYFDRISEFISVRHPYECPQIVATSLEQVTPSYAAWLRESLEPVEPQFESKK